MAPPAAGPMLPGEPPRSRPGSRPGALQLAWIALVTVGLVASCPGATPLEGQHVVRVELGASSLRDSYGSRVELFGPRLRGWLGVAGGDGVALGGQLQATVRGLGLAAGDVTLPLALPSDATSVPGLLARGLVVSDSIGTLTWRLFGGRVTRASSPLPGLLTAESAGAAALAEAVYRLRPDWRVGLRHTGTSQGSRHVAFAGWSRGAVRGGASVGTGVGGAHAALYAGYTGATLAIDGSWALGGGRRIASDLYRYAELAGFSGQVLWRPAEGWAASFARSRREASFLAPDTVPARTVYRASLALPIGPWSARASVHASPEIDRSGTSHGVALGAGGRVVGPVRADVGAFFSRSARGEEHVQTSLSLREWVRPDLELLQRLDHTGSGLPSLSLGGRYERGGTRIGLDYRTEFVPGPEGSQFRTALVLDVRLQLSPTTDVTAATFIDGRGRAHYRVQRGEWFYPGGDQAAAGPRRDAAVEYTFASHVVRGRVALADGTPVEGAAVEIGGQWVYTDGQGRFMLRTSGVVRLGFAVDPGRFLLDSRYEVVSAPDHVESAPEDEACDYAVVVRGLPPGR